MRIPRIYQAQPLHTGESITLDTLAAAHVAKVLRLKLNDQIIVFNGQGGEYLGVIENVTKRDVGVKLLDHQHPVTESPLHITLVQGVSRSERMDYTLQKSVELGVTEIYPVTTQHMSVHMDSVRAQKKLVHWQGVVHSACEQSGRVVIPSVHAAQPLPGCVENILSGDIRQTLMVLDHRATTSLGSLDIKNSKRFIIVVGPEGGLSSEEKDWLLEAGAIAIAMGPRVLRTETAALSAISIIQALWGDFK